MAASSRLGGGLIEWRPGCFAREGEIVHLGENCWLSFCSGAWKFEDIASTLLSAEGFFISHPVEELPLCDNGQKNWFSYRGSGRK